MIPSSSAPSTTAPSSGAPGDRSFVGSRTSQTWLVSGVLISVAIAPLLPMTTLKADATVIALLVAVGGFAAQGCTVTLRSPLGASLVAFLMWAGLSTVLSVDPVASFYPSVGRGDGWLVCAGYVAVALAAYSLSPRLARKVEALVVASGALIGIIALTQFYGADVTRWLGFRPVTYPEFLGLVPPGSQPAGWIDRAYGTLGNPVFLGGYAVLMTPIAMAGCFVGPVIRRSLYFGATLLLFSALVISGTRAAWIGFLMAYALFIAISPSRPRPIRSLLLLTAAFTLVVVILAATRPDVSFGSRARSAMDLADQSLTQKLFVWKHTIPMILERPIAGWGFSTMLGRFRGLKSPEYFRVFGPYPTGIDTPHNDLLHVAFATGVPGLLLYLSIWIILFRELARVLQKSSEVRAFAAGAIAAFSGYAVWLQFGWNHIGPANVFWGFVGLTAAVTSGLHGRVALAPSRTGLMDPGNEWQSGIELT